MKRDHGICTASGCERPARGPQRLCPAHWMRAYRRNALPPAPTRDELFWAKVRQTATCWLWTGGIKPNGYGEFTIGGRRTTFAHRYSYELAKGPIPEGLVVDHLCRVRSCVNPDHLEVVTQRVNVLRGVSAPAKNAQLTHCLRGHPFAGENLRTTKDGSRRCRACARKYRLDYKARQLEERMKEKPHLTLAEERAIERLEEIAEDLKHEREHGGTDSDSDRAGDAYEAELDRMGGSA